MTKIVAARRKLSHAVYELRFLLDRGYPLESAVNFVSNHYRLPLEQRHMLARCIFSEHEALEHKRKVISTRDIHGKSLGIDGYNVLITVESILTDKQVVKCDDGFIRDLRAIFGKYRMSPATPRAMEEILRVVRIGKPSRVEFLFDKQVSRSGELAAMARKMLKNHGLNGDAHAVSGVDMKILKFDVSASSDRVIIKRARAVLDLPAAIIKRCTKRRMTCQIQVL